MSKSQKVGGMNAAILIRRLLFFVLLFGLVFFFLVLSFRGLTDQRGMEQAQIGREIARGNDAVTKVIRPAAINQAQGEEGEIVELDDFYDTYHSPLNPFLYGAVFKLVGGGDFEKFQMTFNGSKIYRLDRVIASVSVIFFLLSIGVNYLLISRIFDVRIAGVTALLMALSDLMWKFTHTGLPQMLMLLLFSCALFFIYRALEASIENKVAIGSVIVAAIFLSLLALAHWMTIWITLGFVVYAAFFFRPKGLSGLIVLGMLTLFGSYFMIKNVEWTGHPGGTAFLTLYGGLAESETSIMRSVDPSEGSRAIMTNLNSLILNTSSNMLKQANLLYNNLGGIIVAPLFFFALLHPFRRESIAQFRWIILLMWIMGTLGMAIFGLTGSAVGSNQLHILFAPVMAAYGLAFVSILWARLELPAGSAIMRYGHFVIVVLISAGPLVLSIPRTLSQELSLAGDDKRPAWPPYWPQIYNLSLHDATSEEDVIFSDQPWAVAWYGDRISVWLPRRVEEFEQIEKLIEDQQLNPAGILMTPSSFEENVFFKASPFNNGEEFAALTLDGPTYDVLGRRIGDIGSISNRDPLLTNVRSRYPEVKPLFGTRMIYFSRKPFINQ